MSEYSSVPVFYIPFVAEIITEDACERYVDHLGKHASPSTVMSPDPQVKNSTADEIKWKQESLQANHMQ